MLSRVANSIYWMNRYIERAENSARFIGVNFNLLLDLPANISEQWEPLILAMAEEKLFYECYGVASRQNVVEFMAFDTRNPNSILSCLNYARENARTVRESISKEMWEHINQLHWQVKSFAQNQSLHELNKLQGFFNEIKMGSQLFYGIVDSTITRGESWHWGRLGRFLERADKTSRFVDVKYFILLPHADAVGSALDNLQWTAVLKSASAYNMYRQQFHTIVPRQIVEFLVLDRKFPRSVMYAIRQAELSLLEIVGNTETFRYKSVKKIGKLRSDLEFADTEDIFQQGLHEYLDTFQTQNNNITDAIFNDFFAIKVAEELA